MKPTSLKEDEVLFRAISPGGTSIASDQDLIPAETAEQVVAEGGIGAFSRVDLPRVLAGSNTAVAADIGDTDEGLRGGAAKADIEKMFQLIYLTFTAPRADAGQFEALRSRLRPMLANQGARPEAAFREALISALTNDHPRARPLDRCCRRSDEPRTIDGVLQEPLRRRERLHVRLRREHRPRSTEATGRALPRKPAGTPPHRGGRRPRRPPAGRVG